MTSLFSGSTFSQHMFEHAEIAFTCFLQTKAKYSTGVILCVISAAVQGLAKNLKNAAQIL